MGLFSRRVRDVQLQGPFVFVVDDVFAVPARGPIFTGEVISGWITKGQEASLLLPDGERPVIVRRLESTRRRLHQVAAPARVGVVLEGFGMDDIPTTPRGDHPVIDSASLRGVQLVGR